MIYELGALFLYVLCEAAGNILGASQSAVETR